MIRASDGILCGEADHGVAIVGEALAMVTQQERPPVKTNVQGRP